MGLEEPLDLIKHHLNHANFKVVGMPNNKATTGWISLE